MSRVKLLGIVFGLSVLIISLFYHESLLNLNDTLLSDQNDGLKNYYNYAFHIKHDKNCMEFGGMNYPYGESILMVDCHPILANFLRFISQNIVDTSDFTIGILNGLMFFSIVISALFVFLILVNYHISNVTSVIGSIGIAFLASNVLLWNFGQYALSYSCFFPMGWYILIRYEETKSKMFYSILFAALSIVFFYIHVYLGFILVSFAFFFHLFKWLLNKAKFQLISFLLFCVQVVVPLLFVFMILKTFDDHEGRIVMPFVTDYRSSIYNIFLPNHSFLEPIIYDVIKKTKDDFLSWDRVGSYVGISTVLILIGSIVYCLINVFKRKWSMVSNIFSKSQWAFLLAAISLLLYSAAFPFRFNMEYLLPNIMKQFIGLGRFAWPFFFVMTTFSFILVQNIKSSKLTRIVMLLASSLLFLEGMSTHRYVSSQLTLNKNLFKEDDDFSIMEKAIDFEDYQAIIPLPYYYGYISLNHYQSTERNKQLTMQLSYNSGLPLMSASLSRPSMIESRKVLEIFLAPYYKKDVISEMNDKPILLAHTKGNLNSLEQDLMDRAKLIYENDQMLLYSLEISDLISNNNSDFVKEFYNREEEFCLDVKSNFYTIDSVGIIHESFDLLMSDKTYRGSGALEVKKNEMNVIFESGDFPFEAGDYNLSFWYYNRLYDQAFNTAWIEVLDKDDNIKFSKYFGPARSNIYHGNWAFNEIVFPVEKRTDKVCLYQKGSNLYENKVFFDELLLRPIDQNVYGHYSKNDHQFILKNNEEILVNWR